MISPDVAYRLTLDLYQQLEQTRELLAAETRRADSLQSRLDAVNPPEATNVE